MNIQEIIVKFLKSLIPKDLVKKCILIAEKAKKMGVDGTGRLDIAVDNVIERLPLSVRFIAIILKGAIKGAIREIVQEIFNEVREELGV